MSAKLDELEKDHEKIDQKIGSKLGDCVDELEQYSRRNCFCYIVFENQKLEGKSKNDVIMKTDKEEINIDIPEEDLDQTNRVGNPKVSKESKLRSLIIKFAFYDERSTVFTNIKKR